MLGALRQVAVVFVMTTTAAVAADINGIWMGQMAGRRGEKEDVAFQFKSRAGAITGKMFGDEFDLPLEEATFSGDEIKFIVTTTNYYNGVKVRFQFTGTVKAQEIEFTRTRIGTPPPEVAGNPNRQPVAQTFVVKRIG